ncbi:hypothetical protein M514_25803 [Trichuris suis]|uniref:Uncharacterized protein n=1 Tax=Trichuris suis TaxID=68888 RepID=A0A085MXP7_9BILA|nr:hypothetical protein M514_25803 [Trichuris suis]
MVVWPTGRLADWSFGRLVVWPTGRLADWSLGRLVAWPRGRFLWADKNAGRVKRTIIENAECVGTQNG